MSAFLPSPSRGVWHLGPFPVRAYALCILLGIVVAMAIAERRWVARGGTPGGVTEIAGWAVPFGIVGSRVYHVLTSPQAYFGAGGSPLQALRIWEGGLGIWGAVAGGALGAWFACRRRGWSLVMFVDSAAPGVAVAQAIGRLGNWFNQELFGRPTTLPWGLEISPANRPAGYERYATYHPTFLYEALWCLVVAAVVILLDRRYRLDHGRSVALYVGLYTVGRAYVEALRIDPANQVLGLRLNEWTSLVVGIGAVVGFLLATRAAGAAARPARLSQDADDMPTHQDVSPRDSVG